MNMNINIGIIGLGYVGLPLATNLGKFFKTIAYDKNKKRINDLKNFYDSNLDIDLKEIKISKKLILTNNHNDLQNCKVFIITVPTPINKKKRPDLSILIEATKLVAKYLKKKDIVIFESTVYPGVTEDICVPVLEKYSNLNYPNEFKCGYSPERINPGDNKHKITNVSKIISATDKITLNKIYFIYKKIVKKQVYKAESIKIAEAAKVIENTQRDINIAFMNELSLIFDKLNLDTHKILNAAKTKWNFLNFEPGLVGGHCIGVDPYYLSYIAKKNNFTPKIILSGRKVNESIPKIIAKKIINKLLVKKDISKVKILILGLTFKENCSDVRNSKVFDLINYLSIKLQKIDVYDPWVKRGSIKSNNKFKMIKSISKNKYDVIVYAVKHDFFSKIGEKKIISFGKKEPLIVDLKNELSKSYPEIRL